MKTLDIESFAGDLLHIEYEDFDEVYFNTCGCSYPAALSRGEVVELIGFLSEFVEGGA